MTLLLAALLCSGPVLEPRSLVHFRQKLSEDTGVVRVLQIGDSHVQGSFLGGEFRRLFQDSRGDAGRGLVFPHRTAGTNGAYDLSWIGEGPWSISNELRHETSMPWGLAGWSLASMDSSRFLILAPSSKAVPGKLLSSSAWVLGEGVHLGGTGACDSLAPSVHRCNLATTDTFRISIDSLPARFDGLVLENGRRGFVWSESGVNGLSWSDLGKPSRMWEQMNAWNPDLVVISLGTNDAFATKYSPSNFQSAVRDGIDRVRLAAPNADILLTFPPDHALPARRHRWQANPQLESVEMILREECRSEGVAGIELRELMGGPGCWKSWLARGLMAKDHIHYTGDGYRLQAQLAHQALMRSILGIFPASPAHLHPVSPEATRQFLSDQDAQLRQKIWSERKPLPPRSAKPRRKAGKHSSKSHKSKKHSPKHHPHHSRSRH